MKIDEILDRIRDGSTQFVGIQPTRHEVSKGKNCDESREKKVRIRLVDIKDGMTVTHTEQ